VQSRKDKGRGQTEICEEKDFLRRGKSSACAIQLSISRRVQPLSHLSFLPTIQKYSTVKKIFQRAGNPNPICRYAKYL
jgi:hypothetical protein